MEPTGSVTRTLRLYWVYCVINGVIYLGTALYLLWECKNPPDWFIKALGPDSADTIPDWFVPLIFGTFALVAAVFGIGNLFLPYLKRTKASWITHLINLILGVGSCIFTLPCAYLFFKWIQPDMLAYYTKPKG